MAASGPSRNFLEARRLYRSRVRFGAKRRADQLVHRHIEHVRESAEQAERSELLSVFNPYRLVFRANHDPLPRKADGGIDTEKVTAITIVDVIDYH